MKGRFLVLGLIFTSCVTTGSKDSIVYSPEILVPENSQIQAASVDLPETLSGFNVITADKSWINSQINYQKLITPTDYPEFVAVPVKASPERRKPAAKPAVQDEKKSEQPQEPVNAVPALTTEKLPDESFTAVSGKPFQLILPGKGWLYIPDPAGGKDIRFMDKQYTADGTLFVFQIKGNSSYVLSFERQDNNAGKKQAKAVTVSVKNGSLPQDTSNQQIQDSPITDNRLPEIRLKEAVDKKDISAITDILSVPEWTDMIDSDLLLQAWRLLEKKGANRIVRENILDRLIDIFPDDSDITPELLYFRALLLEANTSQKDIKKAYALYNIVYSQYPVSQWAGKSRERMIYLDRHFFKVR